MTRIPRTEEGLRMRTSKKGTPS